MRMRMRCGDGGGAVGALVAVLVFAAVAVVAQDEDAGDFHIEAVAEEHNNGFLHKCFHNDLLHFKTHGVFVDYSPFQGVGESATYVFEHYLHWHGLCFQPSPRLYEQSVQSRPHCKHFPLALGNQSESGVGFLSIESFPSLNSLTRHVRHDRLSLPLEEFTAMREDVAVDVATLAEVFAVEGISHVDVLHMSGATVTPEVLYGIDFNTVFIEHVSIIGDLPNEIARVLLANGYQLVLTKFESRLGVHSLYSKMPYWPAEGYENAQISFVRPEAHMPIPPFKVPVQFSVTGVLDGGSVRTVTLLDGQVFQRSTTASPEFYIQTLYAGSRHVLRVLLEDENEVPLGVEATAVFHTSPDSSDYNADLDDHEEVQQAFQFVYDKNVWLERPSGSRSGHSTVDKTEETREIIKWVIDKYNIKSMLDAPCGDMAYMPALLDELPADFSYTGTDIVPTLIEDHNRRLTQPGKNWTFYHADMSKDPVGEYDLIYSRAMLQHLPNWMSLQILKNWNASGSKYLLMTMYLNCVHNQDMTVPAIMKGYYAAQNYMLPPFNLGYPLMMRVEADPKVYPGMYLALWKFPLWDE